MVNDTIWCNWDKFINSEKYKQYFMSNDKTWYNNLNLVKQYIDKHNKRPSTTDKNIEIKQLGVWILRQAANYKKKCQIMTDDTIYTNWKLFINLDKYKKYFN